MRLQTKYYTQLLESLYKYYPIERDVRTVLRHSELEPGLTDLHGTGKEMWDSALGLVEKEEKLKELLDYVIRDNLTSLQGLQTLVNSGDAFIEEEQYEEFNRPSGQNAINTFIIYDPAQADKDLVDPLRPHLKSLQKFTGKIEIVDMHKLMGGENKKTVWLKHIGESEIVLLMLTPRFMDNDDCYELALAATKMRKRVVPVLLEVCLYTRIRLLSDIVPLPANGRFVTQWENKDEAYTNITEGIEVLADYLLGQK